MPPRSDGMIDCRLESYTSKDNRGGGRAYLAILDKDAFETVQFLAELVELFGLVYGNVFLPLDLIQHAREDIVDEFAEDGVIHFWWKQLLMIYKLLLATCECTRK
jgi:hypothetical protein